MVEGVGACISWSRALARPHFLGPGWETPRRAHKVYSKCMLGTSRAWSSNSRARDPEQAVVWAHSRAEGRVQAAHTSTVQESDWKKRDRTWKCHRVIALLPLVLFLLFKFQVLFERQRENLRKQSFTGSCARYPPACLGQTKSCILFSHVSGTGPSTQSVSHHLLKCI